ncbi:hypothetical protein JW935_04955 [candidate division KSB1 bacterium]|nr:hypothetical protein [candidate division KSB1 bacterium]
MKFLAKFIIPPAILLFFLGCGSRLKQEPPEQILVKISDKATISVNEFIHRAEYTPRPAYCRLNSYLHKKIILNSLIAEKLMAIEAGENSPLMENEEFLGYLRGRKEQAMRQWMYHKQAVEKVKLEETEIKRAYNLAGREYKVAYFALRDSTIARNFSPNDSSIFEDLFYRITGDTTLPTRNINYNDPENIRIHEALFSEEIKKNQVLPPIQIGENDFLFIKILGWTDELALTEPQRQNRLTKVTEKLTQVSASAIWQNYVADIMRGKKMDFYPDTFQKIAKIYFDTYFKTPDEQKQELVDDLWGKKEKEVARILADETDEQFLNQPFFRIDGTDYTVADFRRELISHPLVFRNRKMPSDRFTNEFRLAVVDLVRDIYVNKEAYKKGYDKAQIVKRTENMWKDTFLGLYQKHAYLDSIGDNRHFASNYLKILEESLNPYVDSLQQKWYKKIELDFDTFEKLPITRIDLFVKQPDQPFQYVVPLFPVTTTDHMLEYVTKMTDDH